MCVHRTRCSRGASEAGFTLVEVIVAAFVLIVGVMGTFLLIDSGTRAFGSASAREGATGIAREVLEDARLTSYSQLDNGALLGVLQQLSGYQTTTGASTVTVLRRNRTFTVTATECSIDDPKDGYGNHSIGTFCPDSSATGTTDAQPDDLRRVTVSVSWPSPRPGSLTQTMTLSSSGQAIGPPTQTFTMDSPTGVGSNPSAPVIDNSSTAVGSCPSGTACFTASSTAAQKIIFAIDGTDQSSGVTTDSSCTNYPTNPCGKWHFAWSLAGLSDGTYRVTARAVDTSGAQGPPSTIMVTLNRGITATVCGVGSTSGTCLPVAGGYNTINVAGTPTTVTEFQWQANSQRNVVGYEVDNPSGTAVCTTSMQSATPTSCIDFNPPAPTTSTVTYTVYALYNNASGNTVKGQGATVSFTGASSFANTTTTTYGFSPTTSNVGSGCAWPGFGGSQRDLVAAFAGSGTYTQFAGSSTSSKTIVFCSPPLPAGTLTGQVSMGALFNLASASGSKTCNVNWSLSHNNGSQTIVSGSGVATGGGDHYTPITSTQAIANTALAANDVLSMSLTMGGSSNCGNTALYYGGTASSVPSGYPQPGSVTVTEQSSGTSPWPRPSPPTSVTATASGGQTNVSWKAPPGTVAFYRIYRDGQNYDNRYDTCEPNDNYCDQGSGNFTFVDYNPGGTTHTYYVTAVGATTGPPSVPTMAESAFSNGATG